MPPHSEPFTSGRTEIAPGIYLVTMMGAPSPERWDLFLQELTRWLTSIRLSGRKVALVVDPSGLTRFDAPLRQAYGRWRADQRALIVASVTRAGYIAADAMWRGILTAVFWVAKPAIPVELFPSRQAALEWLQKQA